MELVDDVFGVELELLYGSQVDELLGELLVVLSVVELEEFTLLVELCVVLVSDWLEVEAAHVNEDVLWEELEELRDVSESELALLTEVSLVLFRSVLELEETEELGDETEVDD